jgi:hypothetical protein
MSRGWRVVPDGLAGRFALLLAGALLAVNLVAVALLTSERERLGRELSEGRAIERLALIVPLIEAARGRPARHGAAAPDACGGRIDRDGGARRGAGRGPGAGTRGR